MNGCGGGFFNIRRDNESLSSTKGFTALTGRQQHKPVAELLSKAAYSGLLDNSLFS
jgi:hypothetical protein